MRKVSIIPTGDEIRNGIVQDLDSPMVMETLLRRYPTAEVTRVPPVYDTEEEILAALTAAAQSGSELAILIGGSGGGHRFSPTLGRDYSHSAMDQFVTHGSAREIYGKNGHLWCRLICGRRNGMLCINLPGPFCEAEAAIQAFVETCSKTADIETINHAMAEAVFAQYPAGSAEAH